MENEFKQLVAALNISPLSADILHKITLFLNLQTDELLSSCVFQSLESLLTLEQWAWQLFSQDSHQWINEHSYQELFNALAFFNKKLIFNNDDIDIDTKASLLFSVTVDQINNIFTHIDRTIDDNDPFINIMSLWFINHSYFLYDKLEYNTLPIIDHIGQCIVRKYVMNKQYKSYLTQLRQPHLTQSLFTFKMLFYIETCSFYSYTYLISRVQNFPYTADEMMDYLYEDYLEIIHIHRYSVASWNKELIGCIGHLIGFVAGCCWWDGQIKIHMKKLFSTEQITCDHVLDLIGIINHKPFYKEIKPGRSNEETILLHASLMFLAGIAQTQNINWLFRSNTTVRDTIIYLAENALNDEICSGGYVILGETLTDDQLKYLKIADNFSNYCFDLLEENWNRSWKKCKKLPIQSVLRGFQNLSKNDSIQQKTASLNKISLFIELCDQYPVALDIIWGFSFNEDIQQQLRSNALFLSKLTHLQKESKDEQMGKIIHGILWNLETDHDDRSLLKNNDRKTFDIMISYSHKEKVLCKQLYEELIKGNYRVWIDFDQMHGNVMDAMAQGIEQSQTIIICISEQYRKSNYCRAEAHYAFQCQRKIIPIFLQKDYKPDGWLLFLIGQLFYVDFTKYEFSRAMKMLLKELTPNNVPVSDILPVHSKENTCAVSSVQSVPISKASPVQNILEWTQAQVQQWLVEHNLIQMSRLFADCDGRSLIYFRNCVECGELRCILKSLQEDSLRRTNQNLSFIEFSCFLSLIKQQIRLLQPTSSTRSTGTNKNNVKKDS